MRGPRSRRAARWSSWAMGAPKSAMMPSPVYWLTVPSKRCTPSARMWKKRSRIRCHSSASTWLGQLHRALDVGEEHAHLLALALERRLALEDLLGQVVGRVVAGVALGDESLRGGRERLRALVAELLPRRVLDSAGGAEGRASQRLRALAAELGPIGILASAGRTVHDSISRASRSAWPVAPISV